MEDLLLTKEKLDDIKNNPIFTLWLFGNVDESSLTEEEKQIIFARQLYYDLLISDEDFKYILEHIGCYGIDSILENEDKLSLAARLLNERADHIVIKATLMKKRKEKERKLILKEN